MAGLMGGRTGLRDGDDAVSNDGYDGVGAERGG